MSLCPKCGDIVYFAERRTSLGKEWHRQCLRCEECGKVLHPGQHVEHKGIPYCHIPCYTALFGPNMYGHGSRIEAHTNFGGAHGSPKKDSPMRRPDLAARVKAYNSFIDSKVLHLKMRDVNGRLVLEGVLRVFWGVSRPIQLKPKDDTPQPKAWRRSYSMAIFNGLEDDMTIQSIEDYEEGTLKERRNSLEEPTTPNETGRNKHKTDLETKFNTVSFRGERGLRGDRSQRRKKRLSIINNHIYDLDTSVFTPVHGTVTSVRVTSLVPAPEVIKLLLDKFKVENSPDEYCLYTMKGNGERRILKEGDYPLLERVLLGPIEEESKIFIMEKDKTHEVSSEVAQYINLPDAMLKGFIEKYDQEEKEEMRQLKIRFNQRRKEIKQQIELVLKKDKNK